MGDLVVTLVSYHGAPWLRPRLKSLLAQAAARAVNVVVVNNAEDCAEQIVAEKSPSARLARCENRGFVHANNRGLLTCDAN